MVELASSYLISEDTPATNGGNSQVRFTAVGYAPLSTK